MSAQQVLSTLNIRPVAEEMSSALQQKIDNKTKPRGALGQLEAIALQLGQIQQSLSPQVDKPKMLVFAADNGVVAQGVSPFPQEVTMQMVFNFLAGGAAVSVFCRQHQVPLQVVDVGVNAEFMPTALLSQRKVAMGTQDFSLSAAMTNEQFATALNAGITETNQAVAEGHNILLLGEMGIGNTTTSAALMSALTGIATVDCVGAGTGADAAGMRHKVAVISAALERVSNDHQQSLSELDAITLGCELAGFEIVALTGAMLAAAAQGLVFVVDGFICTTALLLAAKMNPLVVQYAIFAHQSHEKAHQALLAHFSAQPILSLGMRLGEGSAAILALPLIQSAAVFMQQMASFESAGVSEER